MATSNPAFSQDMFAGYEQVYGVPRSTTMTVQGTVVKGLRASRHLVLQPRHCRGTPSSEGQIGMGLIFGSMFGGFIVAMITIFRPTAAPWTAPLYAAIEGVFLGAISQVVSCKSQTVSGQGGIVMQAVSPDVRRACSS